jgi:hypothetical protein
MPPKVSVPSFGSQDYWNTRFTANSNPFEWLEAPTVLDPYLLDALNVTADPDPQLLHVGCGTSLLSYHLRAHVKNPAQIHNVDYSEVAIEIGSKREVDIYSGDSVIRPAKGADAPEYGSQGILPMDFSSAGGRVEEASKALQGTLDEPASSSMRWSAVNLLDPTSLLKACPPSSYTLIVDKSTCDSIACSDDLYIPLPYPITTLTNAASSASVTDSSEPLHPLHVMAVHLALLAKPKARWVSLSYSMDRFPFLPATAQAEEILAKSSEPELDLDDIPEKIIESGFPNPARLWNLIGKYAIETSPSVEASTGKKASATIHRPKVMHYIYILERTSLELHVSN